MIKPGDKTINVIIPFEMVIDVEYGLISLIKEKYYDKKIYNRLLEARQKQICYFLIDRPHMNPLRNFMKNWEEDKAYEIYRTLVDSHYNAILNRTIPTTLYDAVGLYQQTAGINPMILCTDKRQGDFMEILKNKFPIPYTISGNGLEGVDMNTYNTIYMKNFMEGLYLNDKIDGKVLYAANYGFNFEGGISNEVNEEAVLIAEPMIPLCVHNEIKVTQVYHFEERDIPV